MIKKTLVKSLFLRFFPKVLWYFYAFRNKRVFIIDIDNTITETGLYLERTGSLSTRKDVIHMCSTLELDDYMKNLIVRISNDQRNRIIFLTARSFYLYKTTKTWLRKNLMNDVNLVMVMEAKDKVRIIKILSKSVKKMVVIDDLTYGHESGKVLYYDTVICNLKGMKRLKYLGLNEINQIKSGKFNLSQIDIEYKE